METIAAYLPGRMAGMNPDGSNKRPVYHYVPADTQEGDMAAKALCGAKPKRRSYGWYPVNECVEICAKCFAIYTPPQE